MTARVKDFEKMTARETERQLACEISRRLYPAVKTPSSEDNSSQKRLYKLRARMEQAIGKLKRVKRIAMRCEKTDISDSATISFSCCLMLVKSVNTA